jgi:hypothetical protein
LGEGCLTLPEETLSAAIEVVGGDLGTSIASVRLCLLPSTLTVCVSDCGRTVTVEHLLDNIDALKDQAFRRADPVFGEAIFI